MGSKLKTAQPGRCISGFTLIELLVVIIILAIVGTLAMLKLDLTGKGAAEKIAKAEMLQIYKAIKGDANYPTGYYHETRTAEKVPPYVACLVSIEALAAREGGIPVDDPIFQWDPNNKKGYRPDGYLLPEDEIEEIPEDPGNFYPTMVDPWGTPYYIRIPNNIEKDAYIVTFGPNQKEDQEDDLTLNLFK